MDAHTLARLNEYKMYLDNRLEALEDSVVDNGRHPQITYDFILIMDGISLCLEHVLALAGPHNDVPNTVNTNFPRSA
jgi:hypothetical protein